MTGRRGFLRGISGAVSVALVGFRTGHASAELPPETTRLRVSKIQSLCVSPQYVASELLRSEGFVELQYVDGLGGVPGAKQLARFIHERTRT